MQFLPGVTGAIAGAAAALVIFLLWLASRKRLAASTVGRAQAEAARLTQETRRETEAVGKETLLAARERSHELLREAEAQIRDRRAKIADLDKTVADRARSRPRPSAVSTDPAGSLTVTAAGESGSTVIVQP